MRKRGQADRDRFTFAAKVGESQREECAYRAVKVIVGGVKLCIQQVARGDAVDRRVKQRCGHVLLDAVDPLLRVLDDAQRLDVLFVVDPRVATQRGLGGVGLSFRLARALALRFALDAPGIDRIDAATNLVARLVGRLACTRHVHGMLWSYPRETNQVLLSSRQLQAAGAA